MASAYLALWNAMLAAREEGIGSVFTRMISGVPRTLEVLGVPPGEGWEIAACATFGYPIGKWGIADRLPVEEVAFSNRWGEPLTFTVDGPLY